MLVYTLLPIIFMFHEFEEIIFLKIWLKLDKDYLYKKFPKIGSRIYLQYSKFTTSGFTLAIAEEFIIISFLTYLSLILQNYYIWFTVFMGFSIHIVIHIIQWLLYRKYIPIIITSVLVLPYCIFGFFKFINDGPIKMGLIIIFSIIGIIGVLLNLKLIHYFGIKFSNWENKIRNN
jgi:hypothetical protein